MDQSDQPAGKAARSPIGNRLRQAREAQGLSVDAVAASTRVPLRMLQAIEAGDYAALPAPTYSAGFVKAYAQLVGLDGSETARQFRDEISLSGERRPGPPEPFEPADPARVPSRFVAVVALAVALFIGLGYAAWRGSSLFGYGADDRARLAAGTIVPIEPAAPAAVPDAAPAAAGALARPAEVPVPAAATAAAPAASAAAPIVLVANDTVWFKVYERGGRTLFQGEVPAGNRYEVPADAVDPLLRTGRPEALEISVGGRPVPKLGKPARLVSGASLSRDALLASAGAAPPSPMSAPAQATP